MDIISLPVEFNKKKIDSRFRLVVIASQRARELLLGAKQRIQTKAKKVTTTSIIEAISENIEFITGADASAAREKAEKIDYKRLLEEKRRPIADLSELEKDLRVYLHGKEAEEMELQEIFHEPKERGEAEKAE